MVEINNAAAVNLKRIKDNGDKIRRKIIDDRFANRQPSEEDIPTLFKLILDFITHYKSYGKSETMDTKKSIFTYPGLMRISTITNSIREFKDFLSTSMQSCILQIVKSQNKNVEQKQEQYRAMVPYH